MPTDSVTAMLGAEQLEGLRRILLQRRAALQAVAQTGDQAGETVELDQSRVGRLSRMDALQGQAMSKEARRRRELELKRIDAALSRLETEDYGYCLRCGEPIAFKRLQHDPSVTLCVDCAGQSDGSPLRR